MIRVYLVSPRESLPPSSYPGATILPLGKGPRGFRYLLEFPVSAPAR
jgi:hypothetical protein